MRRQVRFCTTGFLIAVCTAFAGPWLSVTAADKAPRNQNGGPAAAPATQAEQFKITVVRVRKTEGRLMTRYDMSRASMTAISGFFGGKLASGDPQEIQKFGEQFAPGLGDNFANPPPARTPNLAIDLKVDAPKKAGLVYEVSSNASATDDRGNVLESLKIGVFGTYRMNGDPHGLGRGTILLIQPEPGGRLLKELRGELLVAPGKMLSFSFPGKGLRTPAVRKSGDVSLTLNAVQVEKERIRVTATLPGPAFPANPFNPEAAFKSMARSLPALDLVLVGSDEKVYYPDAMSGDGSAQMSRSSSFATNGQGPPVTNTRASSQEQGNRCEFLFPPLPKEVTIASVNAILMLRDAETRSVPFTLRDLPLPFPRNPAD